VLIALWRFFHVWPSMSWLSSLELHAFTCSRDALWSLPNCWQVLHTYGPRSPMPLASPMADMIVGSSWRYCGRIFSVTVLMVQRVHLTIGSGLSWSLSVVMCFILVAGSGSSLSGMIYKYRTITFDFSYYHLVLNSETLNVCFC